MTKMTDEDKSAERVKGLVGIIPQAITIRVRNITSI